jgi:hypothetical protein
MTTAIIVIVVIVVLIVLAAIAWFALRRRRTEQLKSDFGPEYGRTVETVGSQQQAESLLKERRERVERVQTRPLTADERQRLTDSWQQVQAHFVDDPSSAVGDADRLIGDALQTQGYPAAMFEQRTDVLSVNYPEVINNYRSAHEIALQNEQGNASTEDLRTAMLQYRSLFDEIVAPARV